MRQRSRSLTVRRVGWNVLTLWVRHRVCCRLVGSRLLTWHRLSHYRLVLIWLWLIIRGISPSSYTSRLPLVVTSTVLETLIMVTSIKGRLRVAILGVCTLYS